ncbi:MAG: site-specific integrase [Acidobacteriota bacterium]|nr:site-specific integrase [Acidobacteriota bacterium]
MKKANYSQNGARSKTEGKPDASTTATTPEIKKDEIDRLFQTFLREKEFLEGVTVSTIRYYKDSMKAWNRYKGILTDDGLKEFAISMAESGMEPGSINTFARGVNSFLTWLHENGHTSKRFKIRMRKVPKRVLKTYSKSDMEKVMAYEPQIFGERRIKALLMLLTDTGIRISEALGLTRKDVDLKETCITVLGKGRKERTLPISSQGKKVLSEWMKEHEHSLVFCSQNGSKLNFNNLRRDLDHLLKAAGVEKCEGTFHTFRRFFAKQYARNGGNLFDLQTTMGHTTLEMTRRYTAVDFEDLRLKHKTASPLMNLMKSMKKRSTSKPTKPDGSGGGNTGNGAAAPDGGANDGSVGSPVAASGGDGDRNGGGVSGAAAPSGKPGARLIKRNK